MAASDEAELVDMVATAVGIDDRPVAIRYPRGEGVGSAIPDKGTPLPIGKGAILRQGSHLAILSLGARLKECLVAAEDLATHGWNATVANARFAKPLDEDLVAQLASTHEVLITVEEGAIGGFASHVSHFLATNGLVEKGLKLRPMILPDRFIPHGSPEAMYTNAGLSANHIVKTALSALDQPAAHIIKGPA